MHLDPFCPCGTVNVSGNNTGQSVALPVVATNCGSQIQIANSSGQWAFVKFGAAGLAAASVTADYPVGPGAVVVVTVDELATTAYCILASATGAVYFTRGYGT